MVALDDLFSNSRNNIIVGDLNTKNRLWGSNHDDHRGWLVEEAITNHNYVVLKLNTGQGTYQTSRGTMTHIDVSLASRHWLPSASSQQQRNGLRSLANCRQHQHMASQLSAMPRWKCTKADWDAFHHKKNIATGHQLVYEFLQQLPSRGRDVILSF